MSVFLQLLNWGGSWFAHLSVNQPIDVANINMVIYSSGGGSDEEVEMVEKTGAHSLTHPPSTVSVVGQCVYSGKVDGTLCAFQQQHASHSYAQSCTKATMLRFLLLDAEDPTI